ncbi:MAG: hypothetical protein H7A25_00370 [Leptospiraceae bacterium]|nr:hypothetical protein [Leptospiraceae bacterium]MCP5498330.1 hypothetical protein [Leptospiraceae bacterium]
MRKTKKILVLLLFVLQLPLWTYAFYLLFENFQLNCPNKDVLSWDADLRYITSLQMMDNLRNGNLFTFLFQILDSPTWPVLRNLVQVFLFLLAGHSTYLDVLITFFTAGILLISLAYILYKEFGLQVTFPLGFFLISSIFFISYPLNVYSLSAMLEIQGALFFCLSSYYLSKFLNEVEEKKERSYLFFTGLYSFGLFWTKYPYGYMFLFSAILLYFSLYPLPTLLFGLRYLAYITHFFKKYYKTWGFLFLLLLSYLFIPEKGKLKQYIKYLIVLILVFDFYNYFFKQKKELFNLGYRKTIGLLQWLLLPIISWVLINPDRFSSSGSTLAHVQMEGHEIGKTVSKGWEYYTIYFRSITQEGFGDNLPALLLLLLLLLSCLIAYKTFQKEKKILPYYSLSFQILLSILGITFLTPNHQARHIYHMYPAIGLSAVLFLLSFSYKPSSLRWFLILLLTIGIVYPIQQQFQSGFTKKEVCFTGKNSNDYILPRNIKNNMQKELNENAIILNLINPEHVNKADTELFLYQIAYDKKLKIYHNPGKRKKFLWRNFPYLYIISETCKLPGKEETILKSLNIPKEFKLQAVSSTETKPGCIEKFKVLR